MENASIARVSGGGASSLSSLTGTEQGIQAAEEGKTFSWRAFWRKLIEIKSPLPPFIKGGESNYIPCKGGGAQQRRVLIKNPPLLPPVLDYSGCPKTQRFRTPYVLTPYRKAAFTLAEVLITLGIIGVVAAMTLPTLVNNYKEKEIITQVKKTYSSINQAIALAQTKYGTPGDNSGLFAASKDHVAVTKELATYFNGARYCDAGSNAKGCKDLNYKVKYATKLQSSSGNVNMAGDMLSFPRIVLNNGAVLAIKSMESGCDEVEETGTSFNPDGTIQKDEDGNIVTWTRIRAVCAGIYFDVNGNKLPNQFGRDVYRIDVYRDRVGDSTWGAYGTQSLHNILMDKKNPFVYVNYNSGDKFEW